MKKGYNFKKAIYFNSCDFVNQFKEKNLNSVPSVDKIMLNFKKNDIQTNYVIKINQGEFDNMDFETQSLLFYFFQFYKKPFFKISSNNLELEKSFFNVCFSNKIDIQDFLSNFYINSKKDIFVKPNLSSFKKKHINLIFKLDSIDKNPYQNTRLNSLFPLGFFEDSHICEVSIAVSLSNSLKSDKYKDPRFFGFIIN